MSVYCTNCGATIDEEVNVCPRCGASLTGSVGRRMTHRRRPPYGGPPMGGFGPGHGPGPGM